MVNSEGPVAERVHVRGVVQGVGFRPFVHRLADRLGLAGWVRNGSGDVEIELEGGQRAIENFLTTLRTEAPPLSSIESIIHEFHAPTGAAGFAVLPSRIIPNQRQSVPPDVATCPACLAELNDPGNRRYRYPFITCTDCGPRYTVIESLPYDRERTSMRAFAQCAECWEEYQTPGNRRYHCETNSCPACGPRLWLERPGVAGDMLSTEDTLRLAGALLLHGEILAIRGIGGFHLAVDATNETAVARLRQRKHREAKPLAVMVSGLAQASEVAKVSREEAAVLLSPERPVVLLERQASGVVSGVSPGLASLGVMLPYTPLHARLLEMVGRPLVMTSGNASEEPITSDIAEARVGLAGIADAFLLHDREIVARCDDSVVRVIAGKPRFLRRARGHAPLPLRLPIPSPVPLVAVGPHLKNTLTLVHENQAWISPHIGDLENLETLEHFQSVMETCRRLFRVEPRVAVRDLHPGYLSTRIAEELGLEQVIPVQHHHAHIAAVMAEHGVREPVIGVAFDGTGYGSDDNVWGGEFLQADLLGFRRLGHLQYAPLPGGDLGARAPWRSALGYLSLAPHATEAFRYAFEGIGQLDQETAVWQIAKNINAPQASSMGRLFDAVAAILGVRKISDYEGQAAMELEALAGRRPAREIRSPVVEKDGVWTIDPLPLLIRLGLGRQRGEDVADLAADFHASIAWVTTNVIRSIAEPTGLRTVALAGGVFQNSRLLESLIRRLENENFRVLTPQRLSPNDGAISYGQAAVAAAMLAAGRPLGRS
jgi:hydrogenase maturation protein HypF